MKLLNQNEAQSCADALLAWFKDAMRPLPWRKSYLPYEVWISEVMLQQTQMERGVRHFLRWMNRFPDVRAVAAAPEEDILHAWEGLGYYRRARFVQAAATLATNIHLPNFLKGSIYTGGGKAVCVPGLNCYSCPAATGACPIGSFQAVAGSSKFRFSYYIAGFLILFGVLLGRFICGFLCPFGWFQDLLHKIPCKKLSTEKLKPLTYLKYAVLLLR